MKDSFSSDDIEKLGIGVLKKKNHSCKGTAAKTLVE